MTYLYCHVERMKRYGTMPDENGHYPANKVETDVPTWFTGVMEAILKAKEK